ncbi:MAG: hypothetical protein Q4E81_03895 [Succinatimonas sp.]|nr:hypothetical protein [Succinatimonas sp.]
MKIKLILGAIAFICIQAFAGTALNLPEPTLKSCTDKAFLDSLEKRLQNDFTKHEITREELYDYQNFSAQCLLLLRDSE